MYSTKIFRKIILKIKLFLRSLILFKTKILIDKNMSIHINISEKPIIFKNQNNIVNRIYIGAFGFFEGSNFINVIMLPLKKYYCNSFENMNCLIGCVSTKIFKFTIKKNYLYVWSNYNYFFDKCK